MDLIYTDADKQDVGVMQGHSLDMAYGNDENNFECTVDMNMHCCEPGSLLYVEDTEYGGIVDAVKVNTGNSNVTYSGRTWHGILEGKVLCPDAGQDYLVLNGEANQVLSAIIARIDLSGMFVASTDNSGIQINNYKMNRYVGGYSGIRKMLSSFGAKLCMRYRMGIVLLSAVPLVDYSQDEEWDSSQMDFIIEKNSRPVNHMICLGQGELKDRVVLHLYADASGNLSNSQSLTGEDEVTEVYDNSNAESLEELREGGTERLMEAYAGANTLDVDFDSDETYDIGDIVGARESITGVNVTREIVKKIVTINKNGMKIKCQIGE